MPVRLNVGCGNRMFDPADGWVNIDKPGNHFDVKPDVEADARELPFPDGYADELHAIHIFEHFYVWDALNTLREWNRVLKVGGIIVIETPDIKKIARNICDDVPGLQKTFGGLYGDPIVESPDMVHKWCYSFDMLKDMLEVCGFRHVTYEDPVFHVKIRDMRVVAIKVGEADKDAVFFVRAKNVN